MHQLQGIPLRQHTYGASRPTRTDYTKSAYREGEKRFSQHVLPTGPRSLRITSRWDHSRPRIKGREYGSTAVGSHSEFGITQTSGEAGPSTSVPLYSSLIEESISDSRYSNSSSGAASPSAEGSGSANQSDNPSSIQPADVSDLTVLPTTPRRKDREDSPGDGLDDYDEGPIPEIRPTHKQLESTIPKAVEGPNIGERQVYDVETATIRE